jgi:hypothetical protein
VHSVVVPRLDDLVAELCREEEDEIRNNNNTNDGVLATAAADLGGQLNAASPYFSLELPLHTDQDQPEFQYLQGIDLFAETDDDDVNEPNVAWETATAAAVIDEQNGAVEKEAFKMCLSPASSPAGGRVDNQLVMTQQQLNNNNSTQQLDKNSCNSLDDDLLMTPTAEKLLDEIWLENMNQEAEDCYQHIYPELD